jgi:hypothetical protein
MTGDLEIKLEGLVENYLTSGVFISGKLKWHKGWMQQPYRLRKRYQAGSSKKIGK